MDERLEKALDFSKFIETQANQKNILLKNYKSNLIYYAYGHKFVATPNFINFVNLLASMGEKQVVVIDDNDVPVYVDDVNEFYKELLETYVYASSKYANEFKTIKSNRSVEGLASLWAMV